MLRQRREDFQNEERTREATPSTREDLQATNPRIPPTLLVYLLLFILTVQIRVIYLALYLNANFPEKLDEISIGKHEPIHQIFHSPEIFMRYYEAMEKNFKVYVYPTKDTCSSSKWAMPVETHFLERLQNSLFLTENPDEATLFFIPLSCEGVKNKWGPKVAIMLNNIVTRFPYWTRTFGADHFFVVCNDIDVNPVTEDERFIRKNSIRVDCSGSYDSRLQKKGSYESNYNLHKDISLPQMLWDIDDFPAGGTDLTNRTKLGFWVGDPKRGVASKLYLVWKSDEDLEFWTSSERRSHVWNVYAYKFYSAKFCICPRTDWIDGTFVAEAIHFGCVPVIFSDYYDLPFSEVLDWKKFSVIVKEDDVYLLKIILNAISDKEYKYLQSNLVKVQRHFQWKNDPRKYDAFHMIMYELWLRRHVSRY